MQPGSDLLDLLRIAHPENTNKSLGIIIQYTFVE
jgi:hypothetical protein